MNFVRVQGDRNPVRLAGFSLQRVVRIRQFAEVPLLSAAAFLQSKRRGDACKIADRCRRAPALATSENHILAMTADHAFFRPKGHD